MTFKITDMSTQEEQIFPSREVLLTQLEMEKNRLQAFKQNKQVFLEQLDKGIVLDNMVFNLPFEGIIEDVIGDFGLKRPDKSGSLKALKNILPSVRPTQAPIRQATPAPTLPPVTAKIEPTLAPVVKDKAKFAQVKRPIISKVLNLASLALSVTALGLVSVTLGQIKSLREDNHQLSQQVNQQSQVQRQENKIDVFSQYFLPNYYANKKQLVTDYMSKDLLKKDLLLQNGSLQSVLMEDFNPKPDEAGIYTVTYVMVVKEKDNTTSHVRLSFDVEQDKNALYGYRVISAPKEATYPKGN